MSDATPDVPQPVTVVAPAPVPVGADELFPPFDPDATRCEAPVKRVTLLEDRAQVERRGRATIAAGQSRLLVPDVAPVLRDVSLRVEISGEARVVDARVRRAMRVRREHKPEDAQRIEARLEDLARRFADLADDRADAEQRVGTLREMVDKALDEIPEDAGWGHVSDQAWRDTLEGWMSRVRELAGRSLDGYHQQLDLREEIERAVDERLAMERPDHRVVAWLEIDVNAPAGGDADVTIEYVVPNAIWRPIHTARLTSDDKLTFTSRAAVWQNTGEDWRDCELVFSTARSSLGTEPPVLGDDLLAAQRRSDEVVVQARQVKVQRASVKGGGGGGAPSGAVDLPGVDDGGEVRNLKATGPQTVPSDGRPNLVPLFTFSGDAKRERVCLPEMSEMVFERAAADNGAPSPILAGPVELVRDSGVVGWTRVLFVAPGERFELGFGPDHGMRVTRRTGSETAKDPVDGWTRDTIAVQLFFSNLSGHDKTVEITERIPVSEIEHVKIDVLESGTDPMPEVDDDGFCRWSLALPPHGRQRLKLTWRKSTAPGVRAA
jgi:uncharacterized protein (TIGR02231 family)